MRRPAGVVVSCVVLGFAAFMLLMMVIGSLFSLVIIGHMPMPVQPGQAAPDPAAMSGMLHAIIVASAFFYMALMAWAIATIIGLARMKTWARYSVLVIGGGLAFIGGIAAIAMVAAQAFVTSMAPQPGQDPAHLRIVMIIGAFFYLAMAGIGIWWLVYFSKRSTRNAFALAANPNPVPPIGYVPPPSPYAASSYQVASYIPPPQPIVTAIPPPVLATNPAPARPMVITILAWLFLAGTVFVLPYIFLPFPLFFMGAVLSGWAARFTVLCFAVISGFTGFGLLRLEKRALYTACVAQCFGIVNSGLLFVPGYRDRMMEYTNTLMQKMTMGMPMAPMFDNHTMGLMMLPGMFMGIVVCAAGLVLLLKNRAAFNRPTQAAA